jgi:hypothetical protein
MEVVVVSTAEFWRLMHRPAFVRLSPLSGAIGRVRYITLEPPEALYSIEEMMIEDISTLLDRMRAWAGARKLLTDGRRPTS